MIRILSAFVLAVFGTLSAGLANAADPAPKLADTAPNQYVVVPGDTFTTTLDGTKLVPKSIQITTTFKEEQVTVSATFRTTAAGLNHLQYATVTVPGKNITVNIHNYDYVPNN